MDLHFDEISSGHSHAESEHSPAFLPEEELLEQEDGNLSPTISSEHQFHHEQNQNLLEEAGNLSPVANVEEDRSAMLFDAGDQFIKEEPVASITSNLLDSEDSFRHLDSLDGKPNLVSESPVTESFPSDDFNFDKELPSLPSDNQKSGADLLMNFSSAHFRAPEEEEEEVPFHHSHKETKIIEEEIEHEDLEEEFKEQTEEPVQEASQWKMEEKAPEVLSYKFQESPKPEEVIFPPIQGHRPAPPVPLEEEEYIPPTKPTVFEPVESLITTSSPPKAAQQPETKSTIITPETKVQQVEPVSSSDAHNSSNKTRSVRSSKSETTPIGNTFFGNHYVSFPFSLIC